MNYTSISSLLEKWAFIALQERWVKSWREGAIFPCEMVFLLAVCEECGVRLIFESGRLDGYSTEILGIYADARGGEVYSIDLEFDTERAERCRARLSRYSSIRLLQGDAFRMMGKVICSRRDGPAAVIVDGPKGYGAISLLLACAGFPWVNVIAMHNLDVKLAPHERDLFKDLSGGQPVFYEEFESKEAASWARLRNQEREYCSSIGAARSLEHSSLGIMKVADATRRKFLLTFNSRFGKHQPFILNWKWRLENHLFVLPK